MSTETDLRSIAQRAVELASKATKGPFRVDESRHHAQNQQIAPAFADVLLDGGRRIASVTVTAWKVDHRDARPDAHLIEHAFNHHGTLGAEVLRLLDENERLREALKRAREDVRHYGVRAITQSITASGCEEARDRVNATLTVIDAALHPAGAKERQT